MIMKEIKIPFSLSKYQKGGYKVKRGKFRRKNYLYQC